MEFRKITMIAFNKIKYQIQKENRSDFVKSYSPIDIISHTRRRMFGIPFACSSKNIFHCTIINKQSSSLIFVFNFSRQRTIYELLMTEKLRGLANITSCTGLDSDAIILSPWMRKGVSM
jgi:hypothetical protein